MTFGEAVTVTGTPSIAVTLDAPGTVQATYVVGYGPTANCSETSPTPVLANTTAAVRKSNGCTDTNNNNSDFTVVTQPLNPRNSGSPVNVCGVVNNPPSSGEPHCHHRRQHPDHSLDRLYCARLYFLVSWVRTLVS